MLSVSPCAIYPRFTIHQPNNAKGLAACLALVCCLLFSAINTNCGISAYYPGLRLSFDILICLISGALNVQFSKCSLYPAAYALRCTAIRGNCLYPHKGYTLVPLYLNTRDKPLSTVFSAFLQIFFRACDPQRQPIQIFTGNNLLVVTQERKDS